MRATLPRWHESPASPPRAALRCAALPPIPKSLGDKGRAPPPSLRDGYRRATFFRAPLIGSGRSSLRRLAESGGGNFGLAARNPRPQPLRRRTGKFPEPARLLASARGRGRGKLPRLLSSRGSRLFERLEIDAATCRRNSDSRVSFERFIFARSLADWASGLVNGCIFRKIGDTCSNY